MGKLSDATHRNGPTSTSGDSRRRLFSRAFRVCWWVDPCVSSPFWFKERRRLSCWAFREGKTAQVHHEGEGLRPPRLMPLQLLYPCHCYCLCRTEDQQRLNWRMSEVPIRNVRTDKEQDANTTVCSGVLSRSVAQRGNGDWSNPQDMYDQLEQVRQGTDNPPRSAIAVVYNGFFTKLNTDSAQNLWNSTLSTQGKQSTPEQEAMVINQNLCWRLMIVTHRSHFICYASR